MDSIGKFIQYIKNEKRYSEHTVKSYSDDLRQFEVFCSENELELLQVIYQNIRAYMVYLFEIGMEASTVNRKLSSLKSFYKYLLREKYIETNPAENINSPKKQRKLPSFLSEEQMISLLDELEYPDNFEGKRDRLVLELLYATGIRLAELIDLKDYDVDMQNQTIKVTGKRNKQRIIPFPETLLKTLNTYKNSRQFKFPELSNAFFLLSSKGLKMYPKLVYRIVKKYLGLVTTMEKRSPHVMRHTFATHLLNKGADLNAIKELLGHSSLSATQVYTHNSFKKLNSIYKQAHPRA